MDIRPPPEKCPQPAHLMQPGMRVLDEPSIDAQTAAMAGLSPGEERPDAPSPQPSSMRLGVISPITLQGLGATPGSTAPTAHRRDALDQGLELGDVVLVGRRHLGRQRNALRVGQHMMI